MCNRLDLIWHKRLNYFSYGLTEGKLTINPVEAKIIKKISELYMLECYTTVRISKYLDKNGFVDKIKVFQWWNNCKNVIPSLREWHNEYSDDGLVIIGVHTPEFGYEKEIANVEEALVRLDVPYAVAIDNG